jgi:fluoride exporter
VAWLYVGIGAFLGANARYWVGGWAAERFGTVFPYGTFIINVTGSFAVGVLAAFFAERGYSANVRLFLMVGFLGGYTTFSSYSYEALRLFEDGGYLLGALYLFGSPILGLAGCLAGVVIGRLV